MSNNDEFTKSSWEQFAIDINFANRKPATATAISSVAFSALKFKWPSGARSADNTVLSSTSGSVVDSVKARITVQGGADGYAYLITARATWNDGGKTEHAVTMRVEDN